MAFFIFAKKPSLFAGFALPLVVVVPLGADFEVPFVYFDVPFGVVLLGTDLVVPFGADLVVPFAVPLPFVAGAAFSLVDCTCIAVSTDTRPSV